MKGATKTSGFRFPPSKGEAYEAKMIKQYDNLLHKVCRNYSYLMPFDDLLQCGRIGLLYAIRWWDESKKVPFMTTAALCIKSHIMSEYRRAEMMIRNDAGVRKGNGFDDHVSTVADIRPIIEGEDPLDAIFQEDESFSEWVDKHLSDKEIDTLVLEGSEWRKRYPDSDYRHERRLLKQKLIDIRDKERP